MIQVSVQLDNAVAETLETTARENGYTLPGYISAVISGHCASVLKMELDAKLVLLDLIATAEPDPTFERPSEIPWEATVHREAFC
jgi:hypothetical protein